MLIVILTICNYWLLRMAVLNGCFVYDGSTETEKRIYTVL